ncbi:hypothetical protein F5Y11DRAFT_329408 [Daldinia sp. FL1419]|nr:hypothetical protein F5Y11DRAFT_329408 [Daldinia sp. FL1419]
MAQTRCLARASPARALHRAFVSNLSRSSSRTTAPSLGLRTTPGYFFPPQPPQTRFLSTTSSLQRIDLTQKRPTNANIPYPSVRIVGPDGALAPTQPLSSVLATLNPKTHTLVMVAPPPPHAEPEDVDAAICKIVDNAAAKAAAAEAAAIARRKAVDTKEMEFSWGISQHDLGHKLKRLRQFLDQGLLVEVILAKKRGRQPVSMETAQALLDAVREAAGEVEGAKEVRKMDGKVGGVVRLFFEGPSEKKRRKKKKEMEQEQAEMEKEQAESS